MKLSGDARRKLIGLLGRLGSDNDNEILAAVRLIEAGRKHLDFQWDDVIGQPVTIAVHREGPLDFNTASPASSTRPGSANVDTFFDTLDDFIDLIDQAETGARTSKELDFVADMQAKASKYGSRAFLSEAQISWLRSLAERAS